MAKLDNTSLALMVDKVRSSIDTKEGALMTSPAFNQLASDYSHLRRGFKGEAASPLPVKAAFVLGWGFTALPRLVRALLAQRKTR